MAPGLSARRRSGAFSFPTVFCALALATLACDSAREPEERAVIELAEDTIRLERGVTITDILVRSRTADAPPLQPDTVRVTSGDVVRFISADNHPHAIAFESALLAPQVEEFLRGTGQLRGPPLITEGASWIVSLEGAPPGAYHFIDLSQNARGLVLVAAPPAQGR